MSKSATNPIAEARRIARGRLVEIEKELAEIATEYRNKLAQKVPSEVLDRLADKYSARKQEAEELRRTLTQPDSRFTSKKR